MEFTGFKCGMGIGGWLTNYKRFNVIRKEWRKILTVGDFEHFETYITREDVKRIASFGMDHIRLAFDQFLLEESPFIYREKIFRILDDFISWCSDEGLNVVLDLHKAVGSYCDTPISDEVLLEDATLQDRFVAVWQAIEKRYHEQTNITFELLNEVINVPPEKWNALVERTINAIRELNPDRKIIVGGTNYNSPSFLHTLKVYNDPNVIYTFHFYSPHEFTHQRGVLMEAQLLYNRKMAYPGDIQPYREFAKTLWNNDNAYPQYERMDISYLRAELKGAVEFLRDHPDKILYCGEFGVIRHCDIKYRENWFRDVITILKENNIPYSVWNYLSTPNDGNRFSLVDDDTRDILSPQLLKIIRGNV